MNFQNQDNGLGMYPAPQLYQQKIRLNPILIFLAVMYAIGWILYLKWSSNWDTFLMFIFFLVGMGISLSAIHSIKTVLKTPDVEWTFLANQFLLVPIPLNAVMIPIWFILLLIFVVFCFEADFLSVMERLFEQVSNFMIVTESPTPSPSTEGIHEFQKLLKLREHIMSHSVEIKGNSFPIWKMAVCVFYISFICFSLVQQTIYWLVARRVKSVYILRTMHGILSSSCICGLAAAIVKFNVSLVVFPKLFQDGGIYFKLRYVMDGLLAFPLYIGSMLFIGIAAASSHLNHQIQSQSNFENLAHEDGFQTVSGPTVIRSWLLMVVFHGVYNTANYFPIVLLWLRGIHKIPASYLLIGIVQLVLIVGLCFVLKQRMNSVIQRQFVLEARGSTFSRNV